MEITQEGRKKKAPGPPPGPPPDLSDSEEEYDPATGMVSKEIHAVVRESLCSGFTTRSDTNRSVRPQKMVRGLKFWI